VTCLQARSEAHIFDCFGMRLPPSNLPVQPRTPASPCGTLDLESQPSQAYNYTHIQP